MPIVTVPEQLLFNGLGRAYDEEEFSSLCFAYGLELDEITTEEELTTRERGKSSTQPVTAAKLYKIEVPANRYDLLCTEGLVRALLIFQKKIVAPKYNAVLQMSCIKLRCYSAVRDVRPYVVAAVLRDVNFNEDRYASFIDLQEKLHQTICRKRSLVAIGTHNLDSLCPPFLYDARSPSQIHFQPLNQSQAYTAVELMELYSGESHLKPYLALIQNKLKYPVILDSSGTVLSMPPIINGHHSRMSPATKNVFIECTGTDLHKASVVLDILVTMFSEYCRHQFTVEPVEVIQTDNTRMFYPKLEHRTQVVSVDYINSLLGIACSEAEISDLLTRMGLVCRLSTDTDMTGAIYSNVVGDNAISGLISVRIPPTRPDILHACDIAEDVAIAHGYERIEERLPSAYNIAESQAINRLTDMVRSELAQCGFTEALTFALCSRDDISTHLRKRLEDLSVVHISNPKTLDFQVVRNTLLPGLLHTLANNRRLPLPIKLFEVQDVVLKDASRDVGARNCRRVCALYCSSKSGFEIVHGLLDRLMMLLEVAYCGDADSTQKGPTYRYEEFSGDETYFPGRCADVLLSPQRLTVGRIGVLHPEVLRNFELTLPVSAFEIDLEVFL